MKLTPSTEQDIRQLSRWIASDPHHSSYIDPSWWLTGNGILAFRLDDEQGPLCYVRVDKNGDVARLHTQFASREDVSKIRLLKGMIWCVPAVEKFCRKQNMSAIVFQSVNPLLISFMEKKFGFTPAGNNDYILLLQVGV